MLTLFYEILNEIFVDFERYTDFKPNTCNATVYGDLGRYPLYVNRYIRMLNYWFKLVSTENIILKKVYEQSLNNCSKGHRNWVYHIKLMLENHGFADIFNNVHTINPKEFVHIFKQRVIDTFKQEWFGDMNRISILDMYRMFKGIFSRFGKLTKLKKVVSHSQIFVLVMIFVRKQYY